MLSHRTLVAAVCAFGALVLAAPARAADSCVSASGTPGCFATIQGAHDDAGTVDGDRINIEAGTYSEDQIVVTKGVQLIGAGGTTIIDGGDAVNLPSAGTLRLNALGDDIGVANLTIRNAGTTGASPGDETTAAITVKGVGALGRTYRITNIEIQGRGATGNDYGLWADNSDVDLEVHGNTITGTGFNPVLLEKHRGASDFDTNFIRGATTSSTVIFLMSYGDDRVSAPQRFTNNDIGNGSTGISVNGAFGGGADEGGFRDVEIAGNTITDTANGIRLSNQSTEASGANGVIFEPVITDNRLFPLAASGTGVDVIGSVVRPRISGNQIVDYDVAGARFASAVAGHGQVGADLVGNAFFGNAAAVENASGDHVGAHDNWWGCNEGPGAAGCQTIAGGDVHADTWLVLRASATPPSIETGGEVASIDTDMTTNSAGTGVLVGPSGPEAAFSTTLGTIGASPSAMFLGTASTTLTSGATAGTAQVDVTVDNETITVPVTFTEPPDDTGTQTGTSSGSSTPGAGPTTIVVTSPSLGGTVLAPALRLVNPDLTGVYPSGRFFLHAVVQGPGTLLARGTVARPGASAGNRLAGRRYTVRGATVVRLRMRLPRSARRALNRGRRVTARLAVTFTPRGGGTPLTRGVALRLARRG
jgi:hypothetical protein